MSIHKKTEASGASAWIVRWRDGDSQRSRAFARKKDAETFEAELIRRQRLGDLDLLDAGTETLAEFAQEWWKVHADVHLAARTKLAYAGLWDLHVLPHLGGMQIRRITTETVERYMATLRTNGVGDPTIRKSMAVLQTVLQRAVIWRRIPANPVAAIRKPSARRTRSVNPPSPREIERVRRVMIAKGHPRDAMLVSVLAYAGLRPSEALALRWSDIRDRVIHVERALALGEVKETKTGKIRSVRLLRPLADDLAAYRAAVGGAEADLIFPNSRGAAWNDEDYRNWRKRRFDGALQDAAVTISRPYDLRHGFVSLLLNEGRSVVYVAAQAGHAPTMTLDTYAHVIEELEDGEKMTAEDAIYAARESDVPAMFPQTGPDPNTARRERR